MYNFIDMEEVINGFYQNSITQLDYLNLINEKLENDYEKLSEDMYSEPFRLYQSVGLLNQVSQDLFNIPDLSDIEKEDIFDFCIKFVKALGGGEISIDDISDLYDEGSQESFIDFLLKEVSLDYPSFKINKLVDSDGVYYPITFKNMQIRKGFLKIKNGILKINDQKRILFETSVINAAYSLERLISNLLVQLSMGNVNFLKSKTDLIKVEDVINAKDIEEKKIKLFKNTLKIFFGRKETNGSKN